MWHRKSASLSFRYMIWCVILKCESPRDSHTLGDFLHFSLFRLTMNFLQKAVADMFPVSEILLGDFHIVSRNFYPYFSLRKYVREHFLRKSIKFIEVDVKWEKSPRVSKSLQETLGDFPYFIRIYTTIISLSRKSLRGCFPTIENS